MTETDPNPDTESDDALTEAVRKTAAASADDPAPAVVDPESGTQGGDDDAPVADGGDDDAPVREDGTPFTRKDQNALTESLRKARKDAREAQAEIARLTAAPGGKDTAAVATEADARAMEKFKPLMVKAAARSAFTEAGLTLPAGRADEVFARVVKLLDSDALTITDDGLVEGLAEQVESVRADFPDLFAGTSPRRAPRVPAADRPSSPSRKSTAQQLADALAGGA